MTTLPRPLALSDSQYAAVVQACEPLALADLDPFLRALAHRLRAELQPLGDGALGRAIRELQSEFPRQLEVRPALSARRRVGEPAS